MILKTCIFYHFHGICPKAVQVVFNYSTMVFVVESSSFVLFWGVIVVDCQFVARQWANITTTITTHKYAFLWLVIQPNYVTRYKMGGGSLSHDLSLQSDWLAKSKELYVWLFHCIFLLA